MELRATPTEVKIRSAEDGKESRTIEGYALKFNKRSQPLMGGYFVETLDSHCLDDADMSNVVATFNHDESKLLGRSGVNLTLTKDDVGLRFKIDLPNTTLANDVLEEVRMGILSQCSFAFTLPNDDDADVWSRSNEDDAEYKRTILAIDKLYDVSVVTTPAYEDTNVSVGSRSKQAVDKLKDESLKKVRELKRQEALRKLNIEDLK
ncbi:HK97 family phage prohead protease [Companilactobacillus alimentarius]